MRSAEEFNQLYQKQDPWGVQTPALSIRDVVFSEIAQKYASGKNILELGCGEGHHTERIFSRIGLSVTGVDISDVAIGEAIKRNLANVVFKPSDLLNFDFSKAFDVIFALECLYYLSPKEQEAFFLKIIKDAPGRLLVISAPIIGENQHRRYYTHAELTVLFGRYGLEVLASKNLSIYWAENLLGKLFFFPLKVLNKLGLINPKSIQIVPTFFIYQRCYVLRIPESKSE